MFNVFSDGDRRGRERQTDEYDGMGKHVILQCWQYAAHVHVANELSDIHSKRQFTQIEEEEEEECMAF